MTKTPAAGMSEPNATLLHDVVLKAQAILAEYIVPDSGISDHDCISNLLGLLDGPESRAALASLLPTAEDGLPDIALCAGHADWWYTSRNHLKGDTSCVVCAFQTAAPAEDGLVEHAWLVERLKADGTSEAVPVYFAGFLMETKAVGLQDEARKAVRYPVRGAAFIAAEMCQKLDGKNWRAIEHGFEIAAAALSGRAGVEKGAELKCGICGDSMKVTDVYCVQCGSTRDGKDNVLLKTDAARLLNERDVCYRQLDLEHTRATKFFLALQDIAEYQPQIVNSLALELVNIARSAIAAHRDRPR